MSEPRPAREAALFLQLVLGLQQSAMIALGKLMNPLTQKVEVHLDAARENLQLIEYPPIERGHVRARQRGVEAAFLLWTGEPGHSIVAAAEAEGADLIIVGTRGLDRAGRFLLGSVSDYVVYHSSVPVLVAR